jgi:hypothetical protein
MIRGQERVEVAAKMYRVWWSSRGMVEDYQRVSGTVKAQVELGSRCRWYISWPPQGLVGKGRVVLEGVDDLGRLGRYVRGVRP